MFFNSIAFPFFLLTVICIVLLIKSNKQKIFFLMLASFFFYATDARYYTLLLLLSSLLDYYCGRKIRETENLKKRKYYLWLSIISNIGSLAFFKYSEFALATINEFSTFFGTYANLPTYHFLLPIGISFYTFQTMSYTLDIYFKELEPTESFIDFLMYVAFFPQLVAGPIVRAKEFLPQLAKKIVILSQNLKFGIVYICWGLIKKVVFADNIAPLVQSLLDTRYVNSTLEVYLAALAFGIQIYCDFSGYSDIAIGSAKIFGFDLPINFNKPYFAKSPKEFWQRWHMTLSRWIRDYIYISLGGNRKGKLKTYNNVMSAMVIAGLWHGAAWHFIVWGIFFGLLLVIQRFSEDTLHFKIPAFLSPLAILITQFFVFMGWLIFRIDYTPNLLIALKHYILIHITWAELMSFMHIYAVELLFILLFIVLHAISYRIPNIKEKISQSNNVLFFLFLVMFFLLLLVGAPAKAPDFIYFRF